jgi:hypothetical protein
MQQVDMSLTELQVGKKAGDKRQIKSAAIKGDQKIVGFHRILEFIHILTIDKVVGVFAVVDTDYGNFMTIDSSTCGFDIQKSTTLSKISVKPPALRGWQYFVKIRSLVPVLSGFLQPGLYQSAVFPVAGPIPQVQLEWLPG